MAKHDTKASHPLGQLLRKRATMEPRNPLELRELPTPWGDFALALSTFGEIAAVAFPDENGKPRLDEAGRRAQAYHPDAFLLHRGPLGPEHPLAVQMKAYIEGRQSGPRAELALGRASEFDREVWDALFNIPAGERVTYGELAETLDRPGAARAIGGALGRNPVPIIIPCHRVVRADGDPGGYSGGPGWKKRLLKLETNGFQQSASA